MRLTRATVTAAAEDYRRREPLYPVERDQVRTLPDAFAAGEFGWRDAEWVVRWYYRRFLGEYPDAERRAAEEGFGANDFEEVREVIADVVATSSTRERVDRLTDLAAVDVPVASAFLLFADPDANVVVGPREWAVLREAGELSVPYPGSPSVGEYVTYLDACRSVADRCDCDGWTLYQAIWRLWKDELAE
ncbi:hypothetical protein [Halorussus sp. AFM4]|uniref:hypothetical protein n=1 Tax=Halorussus sp. AFM4 TaxID=3421651 RepID=UPI003EBA8A7F